MGACIGEILMSTRVPVRERGVLRLFRWESDQLDGNPVEQHDILSVGRDLISIFVLNLSHAGPQLTGKTGKKNITKAVRDHFCVDNRLMSLPTLHDAKMFAVQISKCRFATA